MDDIFKCFTQHYLKGSADINLFTNLKVVLKQVCFDVWQETFIINMRLFHKLPKVNGSWNIKKHVKIWNSVRKVVLR